MAKDPRDYTEGTDVGRDGVIGPVEPRPLAGTDGAATLSIGPLGPMMEGGSPDFEQGSGPGPRLMTAATLTGNRVLNRNGEDLGTVDDIMLDVPRGRIAYAVLSVGGFLGIGDKLFAIPWRALTLDTEQKCFILEVAREQLEQAPGFDKDRWPSMADERWARDVHAYYGTQPYWE